MDSDAREMLGRIDERTHEILRRLDQINGKISDHDKRIGKLEQWRAYILGASAVISFVIRGEKCFPQASQKTITTINTVEHTTEIQQG